MNKLHKILISALFSTAAVYAALKLAETKVMPIMGNDADPTSSGPKVHHSKRWDTEDHSTQRLRSRSKKMTPEEVAEFLKTTIIPEIDFENILLVDALKVINQKIADQTPDDQPRPRIIPDKSLLNPISIKVIRSIDMIRTEPNRITEMRVHNIPASVLLKSVCDVTKCYYCIYKGDIYVCDMIEWDYGNGNFYNKEVFNRVKLNSTDETQLTQQMSQVIQNHEYYGFKPSFHLSMNRKARAALENGDVQMPTIQLDMQNITLNEVLDKISEQSHGILERESNGLRFKPFGNSDDNPDDNDPFRPLSIDDILNNPNRRSQPADTK